MKQATKAKLYKIREDWHDPYSFQSVNKAEEYIYWLETALREKEDRIEELEAREMVGCLVIPSL